MSEREHVRIECVLPEHLRLFNMQNLRLPKEFFSGEVAIEVPGNLILAFEWFCHQMFDQSFTPGMTYWMMGNCFRTGYYFMQHGTICGASLDVVNHRKLSIAPVHEFSTLTQEFDYKHKYYLLNKDGTRFVVK